jgi:hypothetical protein
MNYAQSFDEFASSLGPTDIALYAGAAIVAWVLFKDRLNPVSSLVSGLVDRVKSLLNNSNVGVKPTVPAATNDTKVSQTENKEDIFFELVTSWKKTRDLAVKAECVEAIKVADQMFPFLSPVVCNKDKV